MMCASSEITRFNFYLAPTFWGIGATGGENRVGHGERAEQSTLQAGADPEGMPAKHWDLAAHSVSSGTPRTAYYIPDLSAHKLSRCLSAPSTPSTRSIVY